MSAATPGPWMVPSGPGTTNNGSRRQAVWTANGDIQIANCQSESLSLAANSANARLIAAAPDLLEALKTVLDELGALTNKSDLYGRLSREDADSVYAAIAKATGAPA